MAKKKKDLLPGRFPQKELPETEAAEAGSGEIILPKAFSARMQGMLTDDEYGKFVASYEKKRRLSLRINPLKVSRNRFQSLMEEDVEESLKNNRLSFSAEQAPGAAQDLQSLEQAPGAAQDLQSLEQAPGAAQDLQTSEQAPGAAQDLQTSEQAPGAAQGLQPSEQAPGGARDSQAGECPEKPGNFIPVPWEPDGFYYNDELRPGRHPRHEAGMYYIQEASAMVPAVLCGAIPGEKVLDLCAAPGGKTTRLAASLRGEGVLAANEIHPARAKILSSNIERMGIRNAVVTNETPQRLSSRFPSFFDRIVVDAPCSGEGMFRKEEEALNHWSLENVRMCANRQMEILEEAAVMLRPGGTLVYSTCTFAPEENESVIASFLLSHPDYSVCRIADMPNVDMEGWKFAPGHPEWVVFPESAGQDVSGEEREKILSQIEGTVRLWPHRLDGEGHFAAVLRKKDSRKLQPESFEEENQSRKKRKKGTGGKTKSDSARQQMLSLWEEFCEDTLKACPEFSESDGKAAPGEADSEKSGCEERGSEMPVFHDRNYLKDENLFLFGESLYALPFPAGTVSFEGMRVLRPGLQLGTAVKGRFVPAHALGMALRKNEVRRAVDLAGNSPAAYAWFRGESIPASADSEKGWTLVMVDGCAAGWGKVAGTMIKNHYPKGLRRNMQV